MPTSNSGTVSPRTRLRSAGAASARSSRPASSDSGVVSGSAGSLSHRQQPPQLTQQQQALSDLELLADSERQIHRLLANQNPASRCNLNLSYRRLTILPPSLTKLGGDLQRLYLNNNRLVAPPSELAQLGDLRELTLDHNCLSLLPACLGGLAQLRILSASYNPLGAVPDDLGRLASLTHLWLHACQLPGLPDHLFAGMPRLRQLGLNYNRLTRLPDSIGACAELEWLSAEENLLADLPDSLADCACLNLVNLSANRFTEVPRQLLQLLSAGRLRHLLMRSNPLGPGCLSDEGLLMMSASSSSSEGGGAAAAAVDSTAIVPQPRIDLRGAPGLTALPEHWKGITNILVGSEDSAEDADPE